jgi:hypothetical protein
MTQGMSIDAFLGHSPRGGGRQKLLKDWTDDEDRRDPRTGLFTIVVWLHPAASILALYRHGWKKLVVREDRDTRAVKKDIWTDRLVCYEDESVLREQHFRDRNTGVRDNPPKLCPHCLMTEHVYTEVRQGRMSWTQPLFRFSGADDARQNCVLHAGGLFNAFGNKKLTDAQKKEMADVSPADGGPLYPREAWKQTQIPKLEYAFTVVDDAHPENGVAVTVESNLLGQKVQEVIRKSIKELGTEDGNIGRKPYALEWSYDPKEGIEFSKVYDVTRLGKVALRPVVATLLRGEAPSLEQLAKRFNLEEHRANLERHALVKLPWDQFFEPARKLASHPQAAVQSDVGPVERASEVWEKTNVEHPVPKEELFACDGPGCDAALRATDPKCPKCGYVYVVEPPPASDPPKQATALPKRSTAGQGQVAPVQRAPEPAPAGSAAGFAPPFDDGDDVPFIRAEISVGESWTRWL